MSEDIKTLADKLAVLLTEMNGNFPAALEAASRDGFNRGCGVTRLEICKTGEITYENIPYDEFFVIPDTKQIIDENKESNEGGK